MFSGQTKLFILINKATWPIDWLADAVFNGLFRLQNDNPVEYVLFSEKCNSIFTWNETLWIAIADISHEFC